MWWNSQNTPCFHLFCCSIFTIFLMKMLKTGVFWTFDVFWSLLLLFAHHNIIKTHYVLHILGHGIVSLSLLNYCLLTLTHIYQDVTKNAQKTPSERAKQAEYVRMITCYLLITYFLLTYYLLFYLLITWSRRSKIAPEMRPRSERSERSTFIIRTYYVLITYLLLSLLLARDVRDTCFVLAWCLHGSCLGFACYLICIWWYSFRETHVCVCLYVYLLLPRFIKMCPKLFKRHPTERMKRAEYARLIYVLRTNHLLFTYLLLT